MIKKITICLLLVLFAESCKKKNYYHISLHSSSGHLNAVIEIPAGTNKKVEYRKDTETFEVDKANGKERIIQYLPYLGNYGFIPNTYSDPEKGGDGDALDVLVLSESLSTGSVIEIIPIAILKLIDDGELDAKIIAIPADKSKQVIKVNSYNEFSQKYPEVKLIIEYWFLNYNKDDIAKIEGWGDQKEAIEEIDKNSR